MDTQDVARSSARRLIGLGWAVALACVVVCFLLLALLAASQGLGTFTLLPVIVALFIALVILPPVMWVRGVAALLKLRHAASWSVVDTAFVTTGIVGALLVLLMCARIVLGLLF